jgi:hypothetical protein
MSNNYIIQHYCKQQQSENMKCFEPYRLLVSTM